MRSHLYAYPHIIAIGASTGGPNALHIVLKELRPAIHQPILIAQHMPPYFTKTLAAHLQEISQKPCFEATHNMPIEQDTTYVAPGDYHMRVAGPITKPHIVLDQSPPLHFCRPAIDPLLISLAELYQTHLLTIILTGMGHDGLKGAEMVIKNKGILIAQDEETSAVWGMPGAVKEAGLCTAVLPISQIATYVKNICLE